MVELGHSFTCTFRYYYTCDYLPVVYLIVISHHLKRCNLVKTFQGLRRTGSLSWIFVSFYFKTLVSLLTNVFKVVYVILINHLAKSSNYVLVHFEKKQPTPYCNIVSKNVRNIFQNLFINFQCIRVINYYFF